MFTGSYPPGLLGVRPHLRNFTLGAVSETLFPKRLGVPRNLDNILPESLATHRLLEEPDSNASGSQALRLDQRLTFTVHCVVELHNPVVLKVPSLGTLHILQGFHRLSVLLWMLRVSEGHAR